MGDRGNIVVKQRGGEVFLYSHWSGYALPTVLRDALASRDGRNRWDDPPYLTRIIFDRMTNGSGNKETGFGISPALTDNEHALLVVDPKEKTVRVETERRSEINTFTFEKFAALPDEECERLGNLGSEGK